MSETDDRELGIALNRLAREQMKTRLLADIACDMQVCALEGIDPMEYVEEMMGEVERIALGFRSGSGIPRWHHVCGRCGGRISVFETSCRHCGAEFDMSVPFARHLFDGSEAIA